MGRRAEIPYGDGVIVTERKFHRQSLKLRGAKQMAGLSRTAEQHALRTPPFFKVSAPLARLCKGLLEFISQQNINVSHCSLRKRSELQGTCTVFNLFG